MQTVKLNELFSPTGLASQVLYHPFGKVYPVLELRTLTIYPVLEYCIVLYCIVLETKTIFMLYLINQMILPFHLSSTMFVQKGSNFLLQLSV